MNHETLQPIEGERSLESVNAVQSQRMRRAAIFATILFSMGIIGLVGYWRFGGDQASANVVEQDEMPQRSTVPVRTFADFPEPEPEPEPVKARAPILEKPLVPVIRKPAAAKPLPQEIVKKTAVVDRAGSAMMVGSTRQQAAAATRVATNSASAENVGFGFPDAQGGTQSKLSDALKPTKLQATTARRLGDLDYLLTKGSYIDCALNTRLDSTVPGITTCTVTRNIYSDNGALLLVERGSTVNGEYRSNLKQGQARIFVLWNRIKTPEGVVIDIDSPATDSLGATGIPGQIDTHFWKRFGGAILLSLVDDAASIAASNTQSENAQINFNGTADVTSDLAAEVLKNTVNIPPTLYANQGARVGIYIARDLDFSTVYGIEAK